MDPFALATDTTSLLALLAACVVGMKSVLAFRDSKRAVVESASLINVIVEALSSRIARVESAMVALRSDFARASRFDDGSEEQNRLRVSFEALAQQLEGMLSADKKLIRDIDELRSRVDNIQRLQRERSVANGLPTPANIARAITQGDLLAAVTPTERHTLEILMVEGPKGAPELGALLQKSREHTSRLMKKLYMEGYVNRDSNHAPYRYRLNDVVKSALESSHSDIRVEQPWKL